MEKRKIRTLRIVLGDQLDPEALSDLDPKRDALWMAEVLSEASTQSEPGELENPYRATCHKHRLMLFFCAMRHFSEARSKEGWEVHYRPMGERKKRNEPQDLGAALLQSLDQLKPEQVEVIQPGDLRVQNTLRDALKERGFRLRVLEDPHFICSTADFERWAQGRKTYVLAHFYRMLRKKLGILMAAGGEPEGGAWDFDEKNRKSLGKKGPPPIPPLPSAPWDKITEEVSKLVNARFPSYPGETDTFTMPVTQEQAQLLADHFLEHYLPNFGPFQDAVWSGEPILWHSRISAPLNLKLVSPRYLIQGAVEAYQAGKAPIESVEGFVRQILGWREFIRGIYFHKMPAYIELNALECPDRPVPSFFWDGQTDMRCLADSAQSLLKYAYVHHIHRLMIFGLFALQLGVHPRRFHEWHMAMYLDAVDWVSLPNTLGMSQYGDGGIVGTKPYAATGKYIKRMSNYCGACRYNPEKALGEDACPFTVLYWDFLDRHRPRFKQNRRMTLQVKNLERKSIDDMAEIREAANRFRQKIDARERV